MQIYAMLYSHFRYPDEMEYHLRNMKPSTPTRQERNSTLYDPTCKRYDLPARDPLPPIGPKPQVLFELLLLTLKKY